MRSLRRMSLLLLLPLLLAACTHAQTTATPPEEAALRQSVLDWAILGTRPPGIDIAFPDGHLVARYSTIVIQDDGSAANDGLRLPGRRVTVLDAAAIRTRADREGDYIYLRFDRVSIDGGQATVRLSLAWALSRATRDSGRTPVPCGGAEVRFLRRNGDWQGSGVLSAWSS